MATQLQPRGIGRKSGSSAPKEINTQRKARPPNIVITAESLISEAKSPRTPTKNQLSNGNKTLPLRTISKQGEQEQTGRTNGINPCLISERNLVLKVQSWSQRAPKGRCQRSRPVHQPELSSGLQCRFATRKFYCGSVIMSSAAKTISVCRAEKRGRGPGDGGTRATHPHPDQGSRHQQRSNQGDLL